MTLMDQLNELRKLGGTRRTAGLTDQQIENFSQQDQQLVEAVEAAYRGFQKLKVDFPEILALDEASQALAVQQGFINFYADDVVSPYVTLAAAGPWLVTLKGAVVYDCGGYGMLGFGHAPKPILDAMNRPHVMANVMTPNISQKKFSDALKKEIGHTRKRQPYSHFVCMNSGSESVTVAARISDINAKIMTDPGGQHANQPIRVVALRRSFHGRTDRPARFSDSTRRTYAKYLASFRDQDNLLVVEPNNLEQLKEVFEHARSQGIYIEAFLMEPVMGEGNPGMAVKPEFYALARKLTREHGSLMIVDSIQAGLRAHGVLSICDYPGFEDLDPPDMETFSKALNGGQFPLSVLAMTPATVQIFRRGVYGNTMTTNPRAMDVGVAALEAMTPALRANIRARGEEMLDKLKRLKDEMNGHITAVQGTGLLLSAELDRQRFKSHGSDSTEEFMRIQGINVIHGGSNSLRFTPYFGMTSAEIDLVVDTVRDALIRGPVLATASEAA